MEAHEAPVPLVVFHQGEARDPEEPVGVRLDEPELPTHLQAQDAHGLGQRPHLVDSNENGVVLGCAGLLDHPPRHFGARPLLLQVGKGLVGGLEREEIPFGAAGVGHDPPESTAPR